MKDFIIGLIIGAMVLCGVVFAMEYKNAPTVETTTYHISTRGMSKTTESYKDMSGTMTEMAVEKTYDVYESVTTSVVDYMTKVADKALN